MGLDLGMKGDTIPDQDHIARYCKGTQAPGGEIQATAFMLRKDEESLSVNWLEFLRCPNRESEVAELQRIFGQKLSRVSRNARIAILNVGVMRGMVLQGSPDARNLEVLHAPELELNDPSHSGIYNLKQDDDFIAELIRQTIVDTQPAQKDRLL
jgi:hypothetical protein